MKSFFKYPLLLLFTFCTVATRAQDVIIKNDKTEIKSKVTEITETAIKYKKWDNVDGPVYNISKADVFMIIYANGQREVIKKESLSKADNTKTQDNNTGSSLALSLQQTAGKTNSGIDTTIDYKNIKIKYRPTRILYWFESPPTTLGIQQEMRIMKNTLNIGTEIDYFFVSGYSQILYSFYAAPYLPLNRLMGNYKDQDKGLFINGKIGYSSLSVQYNGNTSTDGGLMIGAGADYLITNNFGLSIAGFKFKDSKFFFQAGICVNIL